jgi:acetyl-CoA C-acetyltransferase
MERNEVDPHAVEDVFFGCLDAIGPQAGDIARTCWLAAGLPEEVPGVTIDRQCGSSQQAVHFAAQAVMSGANDLIVAGGVQNMSMIPMAVTWGLGKDYGHPDPYCGSKGWQARYGGQEISQFRGAEMIIQQWELTRDELDAFSLESHRRAIVAQDEGRFDREIVPYDDVSVDEGPRRGSTLEKLASLRTLMPGGNLTAAMASQISDGACAMLVASEAAVREHGLTPRARVHHMSARGADPVIMLTAPIPATEYALNKAGMQMNDIDLVEINEAFAPVVLAWQRALNADLGRVNVNGGAIALGHPLGATGARLMTTLLCELERTGGRYGLQTMCEGGGQANVTIIERL